MLRWYQSIVGWKACWCVPSYDQMYYQEWPPFVLCLCHAFFSRWTHVAESMLSSARHRRLHLPPRNKQPTIRWNITIQSNQKSVPSTTQFDGIKGLTRTLTARRRHDAFQCHFYVNVQSAMLNLPISSVIHLMYTIAFAALPSSSFSSSFPSVPYPLPVAAFSLPKYRTPFQRLISFSSVLLLKYWHVTTG